MQQLKIIIDAMDAIKQSDMASLQRFQTLRNEYNSHGNKPLGFEVILFDIDMRIQLYQNLILQTNDAIKKLKFNVINEN